MDLGTPLRGEVEVQKMQEQFFCRWETGKFRSLTRDSAFPAKVQFDPFALLGEPSSFRSSALAS
ncbi:MAG: hypothetical protein V3R68_00660, partial [Gammaproteobacteria bacterium]